VSSTLHLSNRSREAYAPPRGDAPRTAAFAAAVVFIAAVSVHDGLLVAQNEGVILHTEKNPLGRFLIELGGDVWVFILVKFLGTALACALLVEIYQRRRPAALLAAGGVACFQLGLLVYLSLA
jgi:uncharacterized membrane protein